MAAFGDSHSSVPEETLKEKHANLTGEILGNPKEKKSRKQGSSRTANGDQEISSVDSSSRRRGMVLPFAQLSLTFNAIKYSVDMPQVNFSFSK